MDKPKLSVILPVYNGASTISACFDCIMSQTFEDWELIVVDDGSQDDTLNVCQNYSAIDSRIRVLHKANGGVSSARNAALDLAGGEWVTFVDADDTIDGNYFSTMLDNCKDVDLVVTGLPVADGEIFLAKDKFETSQLLSKYLCNRAFVVPWGKLYKNSIIKEQLLKFDEGLRHLEDAVFNINYFCHTSSVMVMRYRGYKWDPIENSRRLAKYAMPFREYCSHIQKVTFAIDRMELFYKTVFNAKRNALSVSCYRDLYGYLIFKSPSLSDYKSQTANLGGVYFKASPNLSIRFFIGFNYPRISYFILRPIERIRAFLN